MKTVPSVALCTFSWVVALLPTEIERSGSKNNSCMISDVLPNTGRRMSLEMDFRNRCSASFAKNRFSLNQILFSTVSIGFFDDIVIPPESLQQPAKLYPLITFDNFTTSFQKIVQCWPNRHSLLQQ